LWVNSTFPHQIQAPPSANATYSIAPSTYHNYNDVPATQSARRSEKHQTAACNFFLLTVAKTFRIEPIPLVQIDKEIGHFLLGKSG
jgi:hypothetical protein